MAVDRYFGNMVVDHNFGLSKITIVGHFFGPSKSTDVEHNFGPSTIGAFKRAPIMCLNN